MKAAWYSHNGEASDVMQVGELPTPTPQVGEVLVRLMTSGVNPSDVKSRRARPLTDPLVVPHSDGAGVIEAVGAGVSAARVGQRVWIWNGQWQRAMGTCAQYIALPDAQAVAMPDGTDFAAGACMGIPGLTAVQSVILAERLTGDLRGQTVLVSGASSAVGHYITQMVCLAGGRVIGTVGSEAKAVHAKSAGMEEAIFYKTESVPERVKALTQGRGADVIIDMDFSTTARWAAEGALAPHGQVVCYGSNALEVNLPFRPWLFQSMGVKFFLVYDLTPADRLSAVARLSGMLSQKQLQHSIGARFALDQIALAHQTVEAGQTIGNVVVDL
ncbi:NADPH:quinone reductase [Limnohabitans sp. 15K]|jgi:NADPH:quinone reductase|uniref:NADPH:quinone reductase n=1 Tax=Limnohabitans sp. 15K TaxID=1100706 RepID=UPI000C1F5916|nr:NADPH:quinone reductase [Limnohabitans sp. 15K]PIT82363.1 NADPH:quinone oxidoreductase [Limnohabitans sp. 15K]